MEELDLQEGAKWEAVKGGLKGAAHGAVKGFALGTAVGHLPGATAGTVIGATRGAYKGAKSAYDKAKSQEMEEGIVSGVIGGYVTGGAKGALAGAAKSVLKGIKNRITGKDQDDEDKKSAEQEKTSTLHNDPFQKTKGLAKVKSSWQNKPDSEDPVYKSRARQAYLKSVGMAAENKI